MPTLHRYFTQTSFPFIFALLLSAALHIPFLNRPPESMHVWRQSNTMAIARNFYEEEMNIFKPRVDSRLDTDGVTGANFPGYEFGLACIYQFTGEQFWVARAYSMALFLTGMIGFFVLLRWAFHSNLIANIGAISLMYFPDLFYFEITALPDIMALSAMIWGFYFFLRWFEGIKKDTEIQWKFFAPAALLLMITGLVKLYFLLIGFFMLGLLVLHWKKILTINILSAFAALGIFAVGVPLAWYKYANYLIQKSGLADFGLLMRSASSIEEGIATITTNLVSDLPELILNYANTVLFAASIYFFFREAFYRKNLFIPALFFFIGMVTYHLLMLNQMKHHSYYMMPYYPFLALIVSYGGYKLWQSEKQWIVLVLLVLIPVMACVRILPARWMNDNKMVAAEFMNDSLRIRLQQAVPNDARCIVGPDNSGCIDFYFLHKKGFGYKAGKDLLKDRTYRLTFHHIGNEYIYEASETDTPDSLLAYYLHKQRDRRFKPAIFKSEDIAIEEYIRRGASYLYIESPEEDPEGSGLSRYIDKRVAKVGNFYVYQLKVFRHGELESVKQTVPVDSFWTDVKYDDVKAYVYSGGSLRDEIIVNGKLSDKVITKNGYALTQKHIDTIISLVKGGHHLVDTLAADCFRPNHGIVFYNQSKPVAWISICYLCRNIRIHPHGNSFPEENIRFIFDELGIPIYKEEDLGKYSLLK